MGNKLNSENVGSCRPRLGLVCSYPYRDTNATKARMWSYMAVLSECMGIDFLCPNESDEPGIENIHVAKVADSPVHGGLILRALREITYAFKVRRRVRNLNIEALLVSIPSMFLVFLLWRKPTPVIVDVRDLTWEYLGDIGVVDRVLKKTIRAMMEKLLCNADLILVTNEQESEHLERMLQLHKRDVPVRIVRNGISRERFDRLSHLEDQRSNNECPTILYVGNVGRAQDLTTLVDAASGIPGILVRVVGVGSDMDRVTKYAEEKGVKNFEFVGGVPWNELMKYYAKADILYAQITASFESAIPSKLYEYLSVGVPIVYGGTGVSARFASKFSDVEVIYPGDSESLKGALVRSLCRISKPRNKGNIDMIEMNFLREVQVRNIMPLILETMSA